MTLNYEICFNSGSSESWKFTENNDVNLITVTDSDDSYYQVSQIKFFENSGGRMNIGNPMDIFIDDGSGYKNIFSGYISNINREIKGRILFTVGGLGKTFDLTRYYISSEVTYENKKTGYIVSSLTGKYASGISTVDIDTNDGELLTEIKFQNVSLIDAIATLSDYDGYSFFNSTGSRLKYYLPTNVEVSVSEEDILEYSPIEKSDGNLINYVMVEGQDTWANEELNDVEGSSYVHPDEMVSSSYLESWSDDGSYTYDDDLTTRSISGYPISGDGVCYLIWSLAKPQDCGKVKIYSDNIKEGTDNFDWTTPDYCEQLSGIGYNKGTISNGVDGDTGTYFGWSNNVPTVSEIVLKLTMDSIDWIWGLKVKYWSRYPYEGCQPPYLLKVEVSEDDVTYNTIFEGEERYLYNKSYNTKYFDEEMRGKYIKLTYSIKVPSHTLPEDNRDFFYEFWIQFGKTNKTWISNIHVSTNSNDWVEDFVGTKYLEGADWDYHVFDNQTIGYYSGLTKCKLTFESSEYCKTGASIYDIRFLSGSASSSFDLNSDNDMLIQMFTADFDYLSGFRVYANRTTSGDEPGSLRGAIYPTSNTSPPTPDTDYITDSDDIFITASDLPAPPGWTNYYEWSYSDGNLPLTKGNKYFIKLWAENVDADKYWVVNTPEDDTYGGSGTCFTSTDAGSSWSPVLSGNLKMGLGWEKRAVIVTSSNTSSIKSYGKYFKKLTNDSITNEIDATIYAKTVLNKYKEPLTRGNVTINGDTSINVDSEIDISLPNAKFSDVLPVKSYTHTIDDKGFTTSIQYGEHEFDLAKKVSDLEGAVQ